MWVRGIVTVQHYRRSSRDLVPSRKQLIEVVDLHTGREIIKLTDQLTGFLAAPQAGFGRLKTSCEVCFLKRSSARAFVLRSNKV